MVRMNKIKVGFDLAPPPCVVFYALVDLAHTSPIYGRRDISPQKIIVCEEFL